LSVLLTGAILLESISAKK